MTTQSLTHNHTLSTLKMLIRLSSMPTWLLSHYTHIATLTAANMSYWRILLTIDVSLQLWSSLTRKLSALMARPTWSAQPLAGNSAANGMMALRLGRTLLTSRSLPLLRLLNMPKSVALTMNQLSTGGFLMSWGRGIALFLLWENAVLPTWKGPIY